MPISGPPRTPGASAAPRGGGADPQTPLTTGGGVGEFAQSPPQRPLSNTPPPGAAAARGRPALAGGTLIGDRYRIVDRLGAGGMGDVYRAEDLRLGESVALKMLPAHLSSDPESLKQLHDEVRVARQVTHPNVCRVFDVSEIDGLSFISMEYIDGEDLRTLLKRVGRFPTERGIEIARELSAGLAAAHDAGVLHRDLKPANIMIDSRGEVHIADFGIAAFGERADELIIGTPAYMAPELFEGVPASEKSDIYSLGLVLYELWTGKVAMEGSTLDEIRARHASLDRPQPSEHVPGIDPGLERLIARCTAPDPEDRPESVLVVLATLPGGDPLSAMLAAGETPSPELVAAASQGCVQLDRRWRYSMFAFVLLGLLVVAWFDRRAALSERLAPEIPAAVLAHDASELASTLTGDQPVEDRASGFRVERGVLDEIERTDASPDRWERFTQMESGVLRFWYRQSTTPLEPKERWGRVSPRDPPMDSGMVSIEVASDGTLREFTVAPPERSEGALGTPVDWTSYLQRAGLDPSALEPADANRTPPVAFDDRRAWVGAHPIFEQARVRVDVASYDGRPVHFRRTDTFAPLEPRETPPRRALSGMVSAIADAAILIASIIGGVILGWRNLRLRRSDPRRATRLAVFFFLTTVAAWLLRTHYAANLEWTLNSLARIVFDATLAWFIYMALEPTVRRRRPRNLVTWTRMLNGEWRNSLVGFDLLVGTVFGVGIALIEGLHFIGAEWAGGTPRPLAVTVDSFHSARFTVALLLESLTNSVTVALSATFLFVLFRTALGRASAAVVVLLAVGVARVPWPVLTDSPWIDVAVQLVVVGMILTLVIRFGILALASAIFTWTILTLLPVSMRTDCWYFANTLWAIGTVLAVAFLGSFGSRTQHDLRG